MHITVRQKLYKINKSNNEKVSDFCNRFNDIIKEYDTCNTKIPLSEEEIRAGFYNAVPDSSPELRSTFLVKRQTGSEMTKEGVMKCLLQVEAQRQSTNSEIKVYQRRVTRVIRANRTTQK